ncbi:MAG: hypothetical protein GEV03_05175 [Streptosporangiales bacterium]|nr:hypothetical protein [Streptosporangiales bacterium]
MTDVDVEKLLRQGRHLDFEKLLRAGRIEAPRRAAPWLRAFETSEVAEQVCFLNDRLIDDHHAAHHAPDPKRALREVEAKRQILEHYLGGAMAWETDRSDLFAGIRDAWADAVTEITAVYCDHPDYRYYYGPY